MRLIGNFETEKEAYAFYSFLLKEGIQNIYEPFVEKESGKKLYRVWIYDENDLDRAADWLAHYKESPDDPKFQHLGTPPSDIPPTPDYEEVSESEDLKWRTLPPVRIKPKRSPAFLTNLILLLCGLLFFTMGWKRRVF